MLSIIIGFKVGKKCILLQFSNFPNFHTFGPEKEFHVKRSGNRREMSRSLPLHQPDEHKLLKMNVRSKKRVH